MILNIKNTLKLKKKFRNREKIFGGWVSFDNPSITEIFASIDYDFIAILVLFTCILTFCVIRFDTDDQLVFLISYGSGVCFLMYS